MAGGIAALPRGVKPSRLELEQIPEKSQKVSEARGEAGAVSRAMLNRKRPARTAERRCGHVLAEGDCW